MATTGIHRPMQINVRRLPFVAALVAITLLGAACSSDDEAAGADADAQEAGETAETTTEEADSNGAESAVTQTVDLGEWFVDTPATMAPGTITFEVSSGGENPHAFAIVKGESYETLPLLDNGAIDTDSLGADFLGTTDNLETGESTTIDFTLEAGNYVFFCPIQFGPNSHAAAGQVLSVTVG